jgi:hypothetical protein
MSGGQRTQSSGGDAASVAAGCGVREISHRRKPPPTPSEDGLTVFSWGRGEDGQLGLGDTRYDNFSIATGSTGVKHCLRAVHKCFVVVAAAVCLHVMRNFLYYNCSDRIERSLPCECSP